MFVLNVPGADLGAARTASISVFVAFSVSQLSPKSLFGRSLERKLSDVEFTVT